MRRARNVGGKCSGYTLVEVMVALAVASINLLGLAKAVATTHVLNDSALMRSYATHKAYELADRARANPAGLAAGAYASLSGTASNPGCITSGCTPAQMATNDYFEWTTDLAQQLPNGQGVICIDTTPGDGTPAAPACDATGNALAIKIWWTDDRSGQLRRFTTALRL